MRFARAIMRGRVFPMPGLHDILWWSLAIGIVIAAVQLVWIAITPVRPLGEWRPAGVQVMSENARTALMTGFDPFNRGGVLASDTAVAETVTDLPLTLHGVRLNSATGAGSAIIAGPDGVQELYRVGEDITGGGTLTALAFDHVVINRGGSRELLYLDQSEPVRTVVPPLRKSGPPEDIAPPPPAASPPGVPVSDAAGAMRPSSQLADASFSYSRRVTA